MVASQVRFSHTHVVEIQPCQSMSEKSTIWYQRHEYKSLRKTAWSDSRMIKEVNQKKYATISINYAQEILPQHLQLFDTNDGEYNTLITDSEAFCTRGLESCFCRESKIQARTNVLAVLKMQEHLKRKLSSIDASSDIIHDEYDHVKILQKVSRRFSRSARRKATQFGKADEIAVYEIYDSDDNECAIVTPPSSPLRDDRESPRKKARFFG